MTDVVVVGGGIMGLLSARELLASGCSVLLIDQQQCGREASWAGGGIISPLYPWRYNDAITALASWAQDCYPNLVQQLEDETGVISELNQCGLYMLDSREKEDALVWAKRFNRAVEAIPVNQLYLKEPALANEFNDVLWMPYIGNVRNPRLLEALKRSLHLNPNCRIIEGQSVQKVIVSEGRAWGVATESQEWIADSVLVTAGAWTSTIQGTSQLDFPIEPVKGQMLVFEPQPDLIQSMLMKDGRYLLPRKDGRIVVGSTLEFTGFEKEVTEEGKQALLDSAFNMVPALQRAKIEKHWAGLRPGSPGGMPFIGAVGEIERLFVNAGHFRNGLVLAPASCRLVVDLMLGREPLINPAPFSPSRKREVMEMI